MDPVLAKSLEGRDLENGWTIIKQIGPKMGSTGGHFSVGYIAKNKDGKEAFLKAMDFSGALQSSDPLRALEAMLKAYNFERDLLKKCSKLDRIVTPITDGHIEANGFGFLSKVYYLIFEKAECDVRHYISKLSKIDLAWCLRSLHHIAVGMNQLHSSQIAHQDLKPSNILYFEIGSKIGDLGRASDKNLPSPFDSFQIAGDTSYAAFELHYKDSSISGFEKRILADLFLLGSMIFFYFSNVSAKQATVAKIQGKTSSNILGNNFKSDLPYIQSAFYEALIDLEFDIKKIAGILSEDILRIAKQLCEPDPVLRGDISWEGSVVPRYNLQRIISKLDILTKKAESQLK